MTDHDPGPLDGHHGAPESAREDHQLAFRERSGALATMQLVIGVLVLAAIALVVVVAAIQAFG